MDAKAPAAPASGLQLAAVEAHTLAHADQAVPCVPGARRRPRPTVGDLELQRVLRPCDAHAGGRLAGVLERVGEALLHDAEGSEVKPGGQLAALPLLVQRNREPGVARALDELADAAHARLRRAAGGLPRLLVVQDTEQPAHLGQRLAPRPLDLLRGGDRALRVAVEDPAGTAGLYDHDADAVGDHVVHLARDAAALLGRGSLDLLLVGLLLLQRRLVELLGE